MHTVHAHTQFVYISSWSPKLQKSIQWNLPVLVLVRAGGNWDVSCRHKQSLSKLPSPQLVPTVGLHCWVIGTMSQLYQGTEISMDAHLALTTLKCVDSYKDTSLLHLMLFVFTILTPTMLLMMFMLKGYLLHMKVLLNGICQEVADPAFSMLWLR